MAASDCAWEQVTTGDSCYIQPRSCYDCLNTALSNGQVCAFLIFSLSIESDSKINPF